jgi:hypothetical protein
MEHQDFYHAKTLVDMAKRHMRDKPHGNLSDVMLAISDLTMARIYLAKWLRTCFIQNGFTEREQAILDEILCTNGEGK